MVFAVVRVRERRLRRQLLEAPAPFPSACSERPVFAVAHGLYFRASDTLLLRGKHEKALRDGVGLGYCGAALGRRSRGRRGESRPGDRPFHLLHVPYGAW